MPKVAVNYSDMCIYKLVYFDDLNDENIYIGHTTNMVKRKAHHKSCCCNPNNKKYNEKKYQYIRENGDWEQWRMILVEKYHCNDVNEARARERYWVKELKAKLNINEPGRTKKEWYEDNKEQISEYQKQYREANKEQAAEYNKQYHKNNKEKISEKAKEYRENNKEQIAEKKKEWYENNKEQLAEKITCECGSEVRKNKIQRHRKSIKHQEWLKNNNLSTN